MITNEQIDGLKRSVELNGQVVNEYTGLVLDLITEWVKRNPERKHVPASQAFANLAAAFSPQSIERMRAIHKTEQARFDQSNTGGLGATERHPQENEPTRPLL